MKFKVSIFIIFMFLPLSAASEDLGIFGILNEKFIDSINELPHSDGVPDMNVQHNKYIEGWVDIVGFRQMIQEDGVDYVPGNPADYAIVQYNAWDNVDCFGCGVDSFKKNLRVSTVGNQTVASLDIQLIWYEWVSCGEDCSKKIYHLETATFQDFEKSPQTYNMKIDNLSVYIVEYNNSINPKIGIEVIEPASISKLTIKYDNNVAEHYLKAAYVDQTRKGVYFANMSYIDFWKLNGTNITRIDNHVLLNINLTQVDYKRLNISASTPYETMYADPESYNITRLDYKPETILWNPVLFSFISIIAVLNGSAYYLYRRMM